MKFVLYARVGTASFEAVANGCGAAGHSVLFQRPSAFQVNDIVRDADVVVVDGVVGKAPEIRAAYEAISIEVVDVEEAADDLEVSLDPASAAPKANRLPNITDLPAHLEMLTNVDDIVALQSRDTRVTAAPMYEARLAALATP